MATLANGTKLHKLNEEGTGYDFTFTDVTTGGELGGERSEIDTTTLDSAAKESMPGLADNGELSLEMLATVGNYTQLEEVYSSGKVEKYAVTFPFESGALDKKFNGWVKTCKITGIEPDGLLKISATIRISNGLEPFTKPTTQG